MKQKGHQESLKRDAEGWSTTKGYAGHIPGSPEKVARTQVNRLSERKTGSIAKRRRKARGRDNVIFEDEFTDEVIQKVISLSSGDPYLLPGIPAQSTTEPPGAQDQDGSPLPNAQARLNRQFDRVL